MTHDVSHRMPWTILGSASLMAFAMWAPMLCVPPMEHIIKSELSLTHAQTSLLYAAPTMMLGVLGIPGGLLADRIGVRKAAGIGIIIMVLGSILRATSTSAFGFLAFTFIYGVGSGLSFPNLPKLISSWMPREKAGMAMGMFFAWMAAGEALALAITMPLIFPITNTFQGVFFVWSIPLIAAAVLWWALVREPSHENVPGEPLSRRNISLRLVLGNKYLWLVSIFNFLFWFFWDGWIAWAPALLMLKGATDNVTGLITSICIWVGIPTAVFMPRLSYRLGLRKPFLWVSTITLALACWGAIYMSVPLSWAFMALIGVALYTLSPIVLTLPIEMFPREEVGTASGLTISIGSIGALVGPLIGGHTFDLTGNLNLFLLILIGISSAATAIAFRLPETGYKARIY